MKTPIYLDHNATTPLLPEVVDAMLPYLREHFGNPSSAHAYGHAAKGAVDLARARVAGLLGCTEDEVVFTSGGTEANNLAIRGGAEGAGALRHVVTSCVEHPATAAPCRYLRDHGFSVDELAVDGEGRVREDEARDRVRAGTKLVTVMHANNETGTIQPIVALAKLARTHGAIVHTDAAQSAGKVSVRVDELGVDLLSIAGHKLCAPKGVGALYVRRGTAIRPFVLGAGHERGLRPGTENVASIVGLGVACELAAARVAAPSAVLPLRDALWDALRVKVPGLALNGHATLRLPNTLNVRFPGASGTAVLAATPEVAASTGSACHEGGHETASSVLLAMGLAPDVALGAVRLTLGVTTRMDDVLAAADALARGWQSARGRSSGS